MPDKEFVCCPICREKCFLTSDASNLPNAFHLNSFLDLREEIVRIKGSREKCIEHNELLKMHCNDCREPVCNDCLVTNHKHHSYSSIPEAYAKSKEKMEEQGALVNDDIEKFDKVIKKLQMEKTKVTEKAEECKQQVATKVEQLIEILQKSRSRIMEEIGQVTSQKLLHLSAQEDAAQLVMAKLTACQEYIRESVNDWSQIKFLQQNSKVIEKVQVATAEICQEEFEPLERNDLAIIQPSSANPLSICKVRHTICTRETVTIIPSHVSEKSFATLRITSQNKQPFPVPVMAIRGHITNIIGGTSSTEIIQCKVIQLQDKPGEFKLSYTIPKRGLYTLAVSVGGVDIAGSPFSIEVVSRMDNIGKQAVIAFDKLELPFAIAVFQDGSIVVGDRSTNALNLFHPNGKLLNEIKLEETIQGIAISPDDQNILVTAGNRLFKLNTRGERLAVLGFKEPGKAFSHFDAPKGIAVHPNNDMVYVIDSRNHRVQEIRHRDLTRSHTFINYSTKKCLGDPSDIAIDNEGYIYISDRKNHDIKKFSPTNGALVSKIGSKGRKHGSLMEPTSLAILNQELYVGDSGNNRISIFNLVSQKLSYLFPLPFSGDISVAIGHLGYIHVCTSKSGQVLIY